MSTDAPVSVSWQKGHETLRITLLDVKIHMDFKIEMWISILKRRFQNWNEMISKLKCRFQYWNTDFKIEIADDFKIEVQISILKCGFQNWNADISKPHEFIPTRLRICFRIDQRIDPHGVKGQCYRVHGQIIKSLFFKTPDQITTKLDG